MKFHQLQIYKHFDKFCQEDSRNFLDLLAIQKLVCLLDVKNILEIGYLEGLLFGLLHEISSPATSLTSCDISYSRDIWRKLVNTQKTCKFYECKSVDLNLTNQYDFIIIDGDHSYETVVQELQLIDKWATDDCIILIDDYNLPGVEKALAEFVPDSNFAPVLLGAQQVFFVRKGNEHFYNIINVLKEQLLCVSTWSTVEWNGWQIYQYQYTHEIYINALKDIIKYLDL